MTDTSSLLIARSLHDQLLGFVRAVPDYPAKDGALSTAEKFAEVDRIINATRETAAQLVVIVGLLITHAEAEAASGD